MNRKIRVLVITHAPWRNDTSVGNSYSNIFDGMDDWLEFAQIYIRDGLPENKMVHKYFRISEKKLLKSILTRKHVGEVFDLDNPMDTPPVKFSNAYNKMRSLRWNIFLIGRDVAYSMGKWKTSELNSFLDDFKPDIIFGTLIYIPLVNQLMLYAKKRTGAELITYPWDDWYHINRYNKSPMYYFRIWLERHYIKKTAAECSYLYTITEQMKKEYSEIFQKECKLLRKGYVFDQPPAFKQVTSNEVKLLFAGNIGDNRWKVLAAIADAIHEINKASEKKLKMAIYTLSPITDEMRATLDVPDESFLKGAIPSAKVTEVMDDADILVHVEPVEKAKLENCRLSFSTKIVDYLYKGKCVLAVGGQNASMQYLKDNNAAIVVDDLSKLKFALKQLVDNPEKITEYSSKAWECGKENHDIRKIQDMIWCDFNSVLKGKDVTYEG